ncbi:MAG: orotidine-5'-phosphate decarboxylase [Microbacteriaceae bacterium]|nr:orotidine-5'-phosphate decarboxylase [Microbacteriaceae bacterium]
MSFAAALQAGFAAGKHLCVGIDPHTFLLEEWGLADTAAGAQEFGLRVVDAAAESGEVLALKPQVAFYERFGSAGFVALEKVFAAAREAGLPIIADAKRGDIGSTFAAYAAAWFTPGAPLEADALTAVAYQGFGSLQAGLDLMQKHGKGMFVLGATSNPEAAATQQAVCADGKTVAAAVLQEAHEFNTAHAEENVGSVGVVLGATVKLADFGIDTSQQNTPILPILAPGFGAQGGQLSDAAELFGELRHGLIINESRGVLAGDPAQISKRIANRAIIIREVL